MRKNFVVILLLIAFAFPGCQKAQPPDEIPVLSAGNSVSTQFQSSSELSPSLQSSVSEPDVPLREMSYEEYFSKEREWVDESCMDDQGYFYNINENGNVIRFKLQPGSNKRMDEVQICENIGSVNFFRVVYGNPIFIVDDHKIIQTDENGQNQRFIYEDSGTIINLTATRELIYFIRGGSQDTICRIHRQSGTVDEIVKTDQEICSFRPLSNYAVRWSVYTEEFKAFDATGALWEDAPPGLKQRDSYISNSKTGETRELNESDYDAAGFLKYKIEE